MGKIKKIKAERKQARIQAEINKKKRIKSSFKYSTLLLILIAIGVGGYFGYTWLDNKYAISEKLKVTSNKEEEKAVERKTYDSVPEMQIDIEKEYAANFETSKGDFSIKLFAKDAPKTVNNFVVLSRDKFYNGLIFHRIIKDFMIQGGDPEGTGTGGPGYQFEDEINEYKLVRGVFAMANSGEDMNGSQFFIVTAEATDWLDGKHTVFGEVMDGMDTIMEMNTVEAGENDKPLDSVIINKIEIVEK